MIDLILIAIFFSLHQIFIKKGVAYGDANYGAFISLLTTALMFSALSYNRVVLNLQFIGIMIVAGILHFLIARIAFYNAISRIGANSAGSLSATRVFFASLIGMAIGEVPSLKIIIMSALIFSGIWLISSPSGADDRKGIALALLTGFITALSSGFVRLGMKIQPEPVFGSAIGYAVSAGLLPAFFKFKKKGGEIYFIIAGIFVGLAHFLRYRALINHPVSVVEPIISTYPLFTLLFTALIFRKLEKLSRNIIIGSILIIFGIEFYYLV